MFNALFFRAPCIRNLGCFIFQLKEFIDGTADIGVDALFFDQAVEKTEMNIKWLNTNKGVIENWLKDLNTQEEIRVKDIRLPTHLVPFTYDVTINPDIYGDKPEDFNFKGNVKIHVTATTAAKNVTLHTKYLNITESSIKFGTLDGSAGPRYNGKICVRAYVCAIVHNYFMPHSTFLACLIKIDKTFDVTVIRLNIAIYISYFIYQLYWKCL